MKVMRPHLDRPSLSHTASPSATRHSSDRSPRSNTPSLHGHAQHHQQPAQSNPTAPQPMPRHSTNHPPPAKAHTPSPPHTYNHETQTPPAFAPASSLSPSPPVATATSRHPRQKRQRQRRPPEHPAPILSAKAASTCARTVTAELIIFALYSPSQSRAV